MCRRNRSSSGTNYWFFWTERHGFEYYRHGTLSLYAALDVKSGKVTGKAAPGHTCADLAPRMEPFDAHRLAGRLDGHNLDSPDCQD